MSKIKVNLNCPPVHGKQVSFLAPCNSAGTDAIIIDDVEYTVVDADGNIVSGTKNIWNAGAMVSIILDMVNFKAYIQNPISATYQIVGEPTERDASLPTYGLE